MPIFPVCHMCNLGGWRKNIMWFNLNSETNQPLNSETSATAHMVNAIMKFDFLYVIGNKICFNWHWYIFVITSVEIKNQSQFHFSG